MAAITPITTTSAAFDGTLTQQLKQLSFNEAPPLRAYSGKEQQVQATGKGMAIGTATLTLPVSPTKRTLQAQAINTAELYASIGKPDQQGASSSSQHSDGGGVAQRGWRDRTANSPRPPQRGRKRTTSQLLSSPPKAQATRDGKRAIYHKTSEKEEAEHERPNAAMTFAEAEARISASPEEFTVTFDIKETEHILYSQDSVDHFMTPESGGTKSSRDCVMLVDLEEDISRQGWHADEPITLVKMPEGVTLPNKAGVQETKPVPFKSLTSLDNRRLVILKNIAKRKYTNCKTFTARVLHHSTRLTEAEMRRFQRQLDIAKELPQEIRRGTWGQVICDRMEQATKKNIPKTLYGWPSPPVIR